MRFLGNSGSPWLCGGIRYYFFAGSGGSVNLTIDNAGRAAQYAMNEILGGRRGTLSAAIDLPVNSQNRWGIIGWISGDLMSRGAHPSCGWIAGTPGPNTSFSDGETYFYEWPSRYKWGQEQYCFGWYRKSYGSPYAPVGLQIAYDPAKHHLGLAFTPPPSIVGGE